MDRNTVVGIVLIFIILMVWQWMVAPDAAQMAEQQRIQDSIAMIQPAADSSLSPEVVEEESELPASIQTDSLEQMRQLLDFGPFASAASGKEETVSLENNKMRVTFTTKGAKIVDVWLKEFSKIVDDEDRKEQKVPLHLLEDEKNTFEYLIPVKGARNGLVSSEDLYFSPKVSGNTVSFRADAGNGRYFEQSYTLQDDHYLLDYQIRLEGMGNELAESKLLLNWVNYLDRIEKNTQYERNYSTVYFKPLEDDPDYCSCTSDDEEELSEKIHWVSNTNQFFNSTLIAKEAGFEGAELTTTVLPEDNEDLKKLSSKMVVPLEGRESPSFAMQIYSGPNEFDRLKAIAPDLQDVIPFGWSIFGTINRWVVRPLFNFLSQYIGSQGIVILLLTLIVKAFLYPLTYKMLHSQSKMTVLKPEMAKLKEKFKDDTQKQQMESMRMYREFGVNPLGGCLPVLIQMPIWFALYRFFPASIEFRQESFLWATDLSSYDVFAQLPFEIPFYGAHISLFTLIWVITTIIYTYYNSQFVDYSAQPMMKYMQYAMPVMFIFFFNNFASGLTAYLCFSNILNIAQTIITKNYVIDLDKIKNEMEAHRKKPKKKGGFQQRLEKALKEQQRMAEQQKGKNKK